MSSVIPEKKATLFVSNESQKAFTFKATASHKRTKMFCSAGLKSLKRFLHSTLIIIIV